MTGEREFDIVVWGATGFTGALVAEYLLETYGCGGQLRWAVAGRDKAKLDALVASLGERATSLPIMLGDSFDEAALDAMTRAARVVISTVGPYAKFGSPLVAACARNGTHYCDLAGETQWIRQMIDTHHETARDTGARIVHCCGFDSVPMDIGAWFLQSEAKRRFGEPCNSIAMLVKATRGGASGGTIASMLNIIEEARSDPAIGRIMADPYALNPPDQRAGPDGRDQRDIRFDTVAGCWTAPFVMAGINTRIVRRSHALLGYPWGDQFRYREAVMTGRGFRGRLRAQLLTLGLGAFVAAASMNASRRLLKRFVLPAPGEGPDREARENGFFDLRHYGQIGNDKLICGRVTGDRDPGYGSTSKMLGESAVCLAIDELDAPGGVLTPASAMADALLPRLRDRAGLSFEILS